MNIFFCLSCSVGNFSVFLCHNSKNMKKSVFLSFLILLFFAWVLPSQGKKKERRAIVRIETSCGIIRVALSDDTPMHRDNFLKLAAKGFYDGTLFHRCIKDFMIQGGDPDSRNAPKGKMRIGSCPRA